MSDTPKTDMAARRIGAAAARWKSGEINAVAFADTVDRFADAVAELERENAALRAEALKTQIGQHAEIKNYAAKILELERENAALLAALVECKDTFVEYVHGDIENPFRIKSTLDIVREAINVAKSQQ